MSVLNENQIMGTTSAAGGAYEIEHSLRLHNRGGDGASTGKTLRRTPSTDSNRKTWTLSMWHKRGDTNFVQLQDLFFGTGGGGGGDGVIRLRFERGAYSTKDKLWLSLDGAASLNAVTTRLFRDPTGWMHIVLRLDTTQATATNRVRIYINGEVIPSTDYSHLWTSAWTNVAQNSDWAVNKAGWYESFAGNGSTSAPDNVLGGYLADISMVDGQSLGPESFGETGDYGEWKPINVSGLTFGTNGYHLDFKDSGSLGNDANGSNNFTTSNITANDQMLDSPTNNFCTFNPNDISGNMVFKSGNLEANQASPSRSRGTIGSQVDGKIYFEFYNPRAVANSSVMHVGLNTMDANIHSASDFANAVGGANVMTYFGGNDYWVQAHTNGSAVGSVINVPGTKIGAGGIVSFAADSATGKVWMAINNSWLKANGQFDGSNALSSSNYLYQLTAGLQWTPCTFPINFTELGLNCGQDSSFGGRKTSQGNQDSNGVGDFFYPVPNSFLALCSANLPEATIIPSENFNPVLYTGNNSTQSITTGLPGDLVWVKSRATAAYYHTLFDTVRGPLKRLFSNTNGAGDTTANTLTAFNSDGFTLGAQAGQNASGVAYVAWNWKAGGATPSKTYTVTVVSDSGNKYRFDGFGTSAATLNLQEGGTYTFNYPSAHPFKFSTTSNGTHASGSEYTTGVTHNSSTQTTIVVAASAPALYYYCSLHSGMGGAVNTNTTFGSSDFSGTVVSTVSANVDAGFSILEYTGDGQQASTTGHGLASVPTLIIRKDPATNTTNWIVSSTLLGSGNMNQALFLNAASAVDSGQGFMANTAPTSSVFTMGDQVYVNVSGRDYITYCFHSVAAYSKVGTYVGGGSAAAAPYVHCGFKPAFLMVKNTTASGSWWIVDNKRPDYNGTLNSTGHKRLRADTAGAEDDAGRVDILSNGFKIRAPNYGESNTSGVVYLFLAIAENPFKHSNAS